MIKSDPRPATLRDYKERLLRVLVHIQRHLDAPLPLAELAGLACLSPHHFHHVFTGMLGESLHSHIRRLRLERAASHLKLTRQSVTRIALDAGFESHEAFIRAFRASFGVPPSRYRRLHGTQLKLAAGSGVHFQTGTVPRNFKTTTPGGKYMNVTIKQLPSLRVAFMRHIGPYDQVGKLWEKFTMLLGKEGLLGSDSQFIGICHDDPAITPPNRVRYDACVTVDGEFRPRGEIGVQEIPGGDYAVLTHFGPYANLGNSYAALLGQWLPRSGRTLRASPCFEVYFNSPEDTEPDDLITDIHAPLESKSHEH